MTSQQDFRVWSRGGLPVVSAPAEVDIGNAACLDAVLISAIGCHPTVVADLSETRFCDSSALRVLLSATRRAEERGGELRLVTDAAQVLRIFAVTGLGGLFRIFPTLSAALAPRPADRAAPDPLRFGP
jgi:anti-sigma B factor antagonist